jgi:hypothetical protein
VANVVGDIMFPNEKYHKDGEEKTAWLKCGVLLQSDKGFRIKLNALPINMQEGWFSVFEPRDKPNENSSQGGGFRNEAQGKKDSDPEIPF